MEAWTVVPLGYSRLGRDDQNVRKRSSLGGALHLARQTGALEQRGELARGPILSRAAAIDPEAARPPLEEARNAAARRRLAVQLAHQEPTTGRQGPRAGGE